MINKTALVRRAAVLAAASGAVFALNAPASAGGVAVEGGADCQTASGDASDLSPSTQKAWADFICGGANLAGGAARMVSGAWIGAPGTIIAGATGDELSDAQLKAWENWDEGADQAGMGAAMIVSGAYVGAPGYIVDKIENGATPGDLSASEMRQVSFLVPTDSSLSSALPGVGAPVELLGLF